MAGPSQTADFTVNQITTPPLPLEWASPRGADIPANLPKSGHHYCIVQYKGLDKKVSRPRGDFHADSGDLAVRFVVRPLQPLLELRIKETSGRSETFKRVIRFDPDYLDSVEVVTFGESHELLWNDLGVLVRAAGKDLRQQIGDRHSVCCVRITLARHLSRRVDSMNSQPTVDGRGDLRVGGPSMGYHDGLLANAREIRIHFALSEANDNDAMIIYHYNKLLQCRKSLVPSGNNPENAWFATREEDFEANKEFGRFDKYISSASAPALPPWLGKEGKYVMVFSDNHIMNTPFLFNPKMAENVLAPARLWEQGHIQKLLCKQFNSGAISYDVRFTKGKGHNRWLLDIPMSSSLLDEGGRIVLPGNGTSATVSILNARWEDDNWKGKTFRTKDIEYPLTVVSKRPFFKDAALVSKWVGGVFRCRVNIDMADPVASRELKALTKAISMRSVLERDEREEHQCFRLSEVMFGRLNPSKLSPNFPFHYQNTTPATTQDREHIFDLLDQLLSNLNTEQKRSFQAALTGMKGAIMAVMGCPGSGKTNTIASIVVAMALLGFKTLIVGHANYAIDETLEATLKHCTALGRDDLRNRVMRLYAVTIEKQIADSLSQGSGLTQPFNIKASFTEDVEEIDEKVNGSMVFATMSHRIMDWVQANSQTRLAMNYLEHLKHRAKGTKSLKPPPFENGPQPYHEVIQSLKKAILADMLVVGCTSAASIELYTHGFTADLVICEEASTLNDLAALVPLTDQRRVRGVILNGDTKQLGPRSSSAQEKANPHGNWLTTSVLHRWPKINPSLPIIKLTEVYRQVEELFNLTNTLYYNEEMTMVPTAPVHTDTRLSQPISQGMSSNAFFHGLFKRRLTKRLFFIDVDSPEEREVGGYSLCNPGAINVVAELVMDLLNTDGVLSGDISCISFYSEHRTQLLKALKHLNIGNVGASTIGGTDVNTVDSFQGQERNIIVLSTVRGNDTQHPFGFLNNVERMNVATSRARQYLFIVGNFSAWRRSRSLRKWYDTERQHMGKFMKYLEDKDCIIEYPKARINTNLAHQH